MRSATLPAQLLRSGLMVLVLMLSLTTLRAQTTNSLRASGKRKMLAQKYPEAIADLTAALAQSPDDLPTLAFRAEALHKSGKPAEAALDMDRYVTLAPANLEARTFRAELNTELKDYAKVVADLDVVLGVQPNAYAPLANRGIAKAHLRDSLGAFADLDRAVKLAPAAAGIQLSRGWAHYLFRHYRLAWNDLTFHIERHPKDALAYYDRAQLALAMGDKAQALRDLDMVLKLVPADHDATAMRTHLLSGAPLPPGP